MSQPLLAVDFGGTKHTIGLTLPGSQRWLAHRRIFSPPGADAQYDLQTVIEAARDLLAGATPAAIGVSFGGPVDFAKGTVLLSHHVPGWERVPLRELLAESLGAPAAVDNDANVAALGELQFGAGKGFRHLFYVTVSTGVGGGWILDGLPWRGANGVAGEIGHTVVQHDGPLCLCGKRGCVERLASGPYMSLDAEATLTEDPARGEVLRRLAGSTGIDGEVLAVAANAGDDVATEILTRGAWAVGTGLGNAANLINPELILLGGGVTKSGPLWWGTVEQTVQSVVLPEVKVVVRPAALVDDAPLWGAVALAGMLLERK